MKTARKNNVIHRLNEIESVIKENGTKYFITDRRKGKYSDGTTDWQMTVYQRSCRDKKQADSMLSDPTDIIEIAKEIGVGYYICCDQYGNDNTKGCPYIQLY